MILKNMIIVKNATKVMLFLIMKRVVKNSKIVINWLKEIKDVVNVFIISIQMQKVSVKELYAKTMIQMMFAPNVMKDIILIKIKIAKKLQLNIA